MTDTGLAPIELPSDASILIADDHVLVRDGLKLLVASIVGHVRFVEAGDADSLLKMAALPPPPQVALVDLNMPGMDRGSRLAELAHRHPELPVVVISALTSPDVVRRTLALANVWAFVPKSATVHHMRTALQAAFDRQKPAFSQVLPADSASQITLTPRLEEIRELLRQGMSNKQIASTLGIGEGTVKNYMGEIFRALNVTNRTQAAQFDADARSGL